LGRLGPAHPPTLKWGVADPPGNTLLSHMCYTPNFVAVGKPFGRIGA